MEKLGIDEEQLEKEVTKQYNSLPEINTYLALIKSLEMLINIWTLCSFI